MLLQLLDWAKERTWETSKKLGDYTSLPDYEANPHLEAANRSLKEAYSELEKAMLSIRSGFNQTG